MVHLPEDSGDLISEYLGRMAGFGIAHYAHDFLVTPSEDGTHTILYCFDCNELSILPKGGDFNAYGLYEAE